jgi:hypothetical protein
MNDTTTKAIDSAVHVQNILDAFHRSNSENVRLRAEVHILRRQLRDLEPPTGDVFRDIAAERDAETKQSCPDCGESMVQMGRTASCTACEAMFAVNLDGSLGQRLSASVATSVDNRRDST